MRAFARLTLMGLALLSTGTATGSGTYDPMPWRSPGVRAAVYSTEVDPHTVRDDDFTRQTDPAVWRDLSVRRIAFYENGTDWRLWRIANLAKPDGPLWVVPHDNENAAFAAGMIALRSWGGSMVVVDTGGSRFSGSASTGNLVDPNRNFRDELPLYAGAVLADLQPLPQLIVALHTNAPGYDASASSCPASGYTGSGDISIRLCNARYTPSPARPPLWPYDDEDSLMLVPYRAGTVPQTAYCGQRLARSGFNVLFERVSATDGSLSNYATLHGLRYVNIETRDRGSTAQGIADASNRMITMLDAMMDRCGDVATVALRPPRQK